MRRESDLASNCPLAPFLLSFAMMNSSPRATRTIDWLLFNLRWLLLVVVGVVAFLSSGEKLPIAMLLLAAAA